MKTGTKIFLSCLCVGLLMTLIGKRDFVFANYDDTNKQMMFQSITKQQQNFEELKRLVSSAPVLRFYNVNEPVTILDDASSKGLVVVLLQNKQPVAYGPRALSEKQRRYVQIDREMLATLYGYKNFDHYINGRRAVIESDHKPLVAIFDKPLYRTPRLQRMLMKLQRYGLRIVYVPGKLMFISDALSRAYLPDSNDKLIDDELILVTLKNNYLFV
ncbi:unnamed protein product [Mytilus coruscus]|uniref:Reverse transcriptase RNase H-like domain-containing protein n=1 Tax=Mytilus coruscus TaxID=42192 RepID=A0A6J8BGR2_MYTCO|nr:unnamed protein product [Mytilus coruscus]